MAKVAIVQITTPAGEQVTAVEVTLSGEPITISNGGVEADPELVHLTNDLIEFVRSKYDGK